MSSSDVEFWVELSKTNPGLAKSHLQRHMAMRKKPPPTEDMSYFKESEGYCRFDY